jgi:hypothetical protein
MAITKLAWLHASSSAVGSTTQWSPICRCYHVSILLGLQGTSTSVPHTCLKETYYSHIRLTVDVRKGVNIKRENFTIQLKHNNQQLTVSISCQISISKVCCLIKQSAFVFQFMNSHYHFTGQDSCKNIIQSGQKVTVPLLNINCGNSNGMSCGHACALSCLKHSLMHCCVLYDMHWSICGVTVVNTCSTALCNSSLLWQWCAATCPLIIPHKELPSVVRSGVCSGQDNGVGEVGVPRLIQQPR